MCFNSILIVLHIQICERTLMICRYHQPGLRSRDLSLNGWLHLTMQLPLRHRSLWVLLQFSQRQVLRPFEALFVWANWTKRVVLLQARKAMAARTSSKRSLSSLRKERYTTQVHWVPPSNQQPNPTQDHRLRITLCPRSAISPLFLRNPRCRASRLRVRRPRGSRSHR